MKQKNSRMQYSTIKSTLLIVLLLAAFVVISTGCRKKAIQITESHRNASLLLDGGGFQLPLKGIFQVIKARADEQGESEYSGNFSLFNAEKQLRSKNNIGKFSPHGHFVLDSTMKAVGYSIFLFDHEDSRFIDPKDASKTVHEFIPIIRTSYCSDCNLKTEMIRIRSLEGLDQINSIEFIDFASCAFATGIWSDLHFMSEKGRLRGISLTNGEELLDVRGNATAPEIKGLAVHLTDATRLKEFGIAFPRLTFLCVAVPNRESINILFQHDILREHFPNLKGLVIGASKWPKSEFDQFSKGRDSHSKIRFAAQLIPSEIELICMDGRLMSMADMVNYDEFGITLRYKSGRISNKTKLDENIEVIYMGFGYSAGGARSMNVMEYGSLDKYWRIF